MHARIQRLVHLSVESRQSVVRFDVPIRGPKHRLFSELLCVSGSEQRVCGQPLSGGTGHHRTRHSVRLPLVLGRVLSVRHHCPLLQTRSAVRSQRTRYCPTNCPTNRYQPLPTAANHCHPLPSAHSPAHCPALLCAVPCAALDFAEREVWIGLWIR
jgi:hypothetical protein